MKKEKLSTADKVEILNYSEVLLHFGLILTISSVLILLSFFNILDFKITMIIIGIIFILNLFFGKADIYSTSSRMFYLLKYKLPGKKLRKFFKYFILLYLLILPLLILIPIFNNSFNLSKIMYFIIGLYLILPILIIGIYSIIYSTIFRKIIDT